MDGNTQSLKMVYHGWDGYQISLVRAIAPLTQEQLIWRPTSQLSSVGEVAEHISVGRIDWCHRMNAPGSAELARRTPAAGSLAEDAADLVKWLNDTWDMIANILTSWQVADLAKTYQHSYWGNTYAISHQWTIWRIMAHDIHHGGQLSIMLASQGIQAPDLLDLGGHLTVPPMVSSGSGEQ